MHTSKTFGPTGKVQIRELGVLPAQPVAIDAIGSHRGTGHYAFGATELEIGVFERIEQGVQDEIVRMSEHHLVDPVQDMVPYGASAVLSTDGTCHKGDDPGKRYEESALVNLREK